MKVRILTPFIEAGPALNKGDVLSPPEHIAREWIADGRAQEIPEPEVSKPSFRGEISKPVQTVRAEIRRAVAKVRKK